MTNLAATGGVPGPGRIGRVAIGDLLERKSARRFPDRVALTDGARRVTLSPSSSATPIASPTIWWRAGLKPGDKIATICNNSVEFVKALFGIHRAGLVWVPINTMLGPVRHGLHPRSCRGEVRADRRQSAMRSRIAAPRCDKRGIDLIAVDLTGKAASLGLPELQRSDRRASPRSSRRSTFDDRDLAMIIYTSGTTSRPKGAMHCHLAVVMAVMSNAIEMQLTATTASPGSFRCSTAPAMCCC